MKHTIKFTYTKKPVKTVEQQKLRAAYASVAVNLILTAVKFTCGILCCAPALVADGIHSSADLFSTVIVLVGIRLTAQSEKRKGFRKSESIASILLSGILFFAGIRIGYGGFVSILTGAYQNLPPPSAAAVWIAAFSVLLKLLLSRYLRRIARETASVALRADALHQLSDALASLAVCLGIIATIAGFPIADPLASILIAGFLANASVGIFREAVTGIFSRAEAHLDSDPPSGFGEDP